MDMPAPAKPTTAVANPASRPVAANEYTINRRSCSVTAIDNPVVISLSTSPTATVVKGSVTIAPVGTKVLVVAGAIYG